MTAHSEFSKCQVKVNWGKDSEFIVQDNKISILSKMSSVHYLANTRLNMKHDSRVMGASKKQGHCLNWPKLIF